MRLLCTLILLTNCLMVAGQTAPEKGDKEQKAFTNYSGKYLDNESKYTDASGNSVVIQNSLPKGGGQYTDAAGTTLNYVIFWTRVINETDAPLELTIKFPAEPYRIFPSSDSFLKIFLPPAEMSLDKESSFDYGLVGLQSFLDAGFNQPTLLQKVIDPKGEGLFYVTVLFYQARGTARSALVMKGQDLFYRITVIPEVDSAMIPCGHFVFKGQKK